MQNLLQCTYGLKNCEPVSFETDARDSRTELKINLQTDIEKFKQTH